MSNVALAISWHELCLGLDVMMVGLCHNHIDYIHYYTLYNCVCDKLNLESWILITIFGDNYNQ